MHISAVSREQRRSLQPERVQLSITDLLHYQTENWAPFPRVFHNHKRVRSEPASVMSALVRSMAGECAEIVIMSAHVIKRKHRLSRMRQQGTTTKQCPKFIHPVACQYATTTVTEMMSQTRELKAKVNPMASTRLDSCMRSPYTTFHRVQSTAHQPIPHVVDRTPTHDTPLCSTVCSQARNAHTKRLAQELHCHLCAPEKSLVIWCVSCLIHGRSLTRLPP